jgi:hypothetical protein
LQTWAALDEREATLTFGLERETSFTVGASSADQEGTAE